MRQIKEGDYVVRKSYNRDIDFVVDRILDLRNGKKIAILKGVEIRIEADSYIEDLELIDARTLKKKNKMMEQNVEEVLRKYRSRYAGVVYTGKILHLDGDRRYSQKSLRYYKNLSLNAIVKNIPEARQSYNVKNLILRYNPDILVVTGHDAMLKNGRDYSNIYNYRNSKYFVETVKEARKVKKSRDELVIFGGACQSYFEEIMKAGANFASSPGRILINFIDPLIVASKVATTENNRYIFIEEIAKELKDGLRGVGGTSAMGKKKMEM